MSSVGTWLLLLLALVDSEALLWTCDPVAPVSNFTFQQVSGGPWYLLEVISPLPGENRDRCTAVDFLNSSGVLQMRSRSYAAHGVVDETTQLKLDDDGSALWEMTELGSEARVTHVSEDGELVALTVCVSALAYDWTSVLGRNPSLRGVEDVRRSLEQAGLANTLSPNTLRVDNCTYIAQQQ